MTRLRVLNVMNVFEELALNAHSSYTIKLSVLKTLKTGIYRA